MIKIDVINPHNEKLVSNESLGKNGNMISVCDLIQILKSKCNIWIFDLRSSDSFVKSHIIKSKHINCTTNLMAKQSIMNLKKQINSTHNIPDKIVMYNQTDAIYNDFLLRFIDKLDLQFDAKFLEGGFEKFTKFAPKEFIENMQICSPTNRDVISEDIMLTKISEIEQHLYLGNADDSENLDLLRSVGITHILCVTSNTKLYFEDLNFFEYKRIEANDSCNQNLLQYFDESYQFIENAKMKNGKVFVHCLAGVSRSVTIVLAYLIKKYNMKALQALDMVKEKRSIASPNLNFLGQLDRYYRELNL